MIEITQDMRQVWDKLQNEGLSLFGIAGLMGNLYAESGVRSVCLENLCKQRYRERQGKVYTDATYTAFVDDGTISRGEFLSPMGKQYGYGLAQWTSPGRKAGLYDLCKAKSVSIGDLETQVDYLAMEMQASYKTTWAALKAAADIYTPTVKVLVDYEQPADVSDAVKQLRCSYSQEIYDKLKGSDAMTTKEKALQWMLDLAADQSHGYSQQNRWGPDYDCSSSVISAWQTAGVPVKSRGATYTGNMRSVFLGCGFKDVTKQVNLSTGAGLQPSDVLLNEYGRGTSGNGHTAMYAGDGKIVHARGQSYGTPATGDQGTEIAVTPYKDNPWDCVLRYSDSEPEPSKIVGYCSVTLPQLLQGAVCPEVKSIQACLNAKGYKGKNGKALTLDGELGENTAYAIEQLQRKAGMVGINYGSVAAKTWELILK